MGGEKLPLCPTLRYIDRGRYIATGKLLPAIKKQLKKQGSQKFPPRMPTFAANCKTAGELGQATFFYA